MMSTTPPVAATQINVRGPTWGWALKRALAGLIIMLTFTGVAAYLAHASIEQVPEPVDSISIGTPAAALLK